MRYATLRADQGFAAGTAATQLEASVHVDGAVAFEAAQGFDGSARLIQPRLQLDDGAGGIVTGTEAQYPQVVRYWTVDGFDPQAEVTGDLSVSASLDGGERSWAVSVVASTGSAWAGDLATGPLGYEVDRGGPPPGERVPVDLGVRLLDIAAGQSYALPLLSAGHAASSRRRISSEGHVMEISGAGPEIRWKDVEIDLELLPGHGLTHGEIAILAAQAAGVPDAQIGIDAELGSPRSVGMQMSCRPLWQVLQDILRPIGHQALFTRTDAVLVTTRLDVGADDPAIIELRLEGSATAAVSDLEGTGAEIEADAAVPTCVEVTGLRLAETLQAPGTGLVTEEVIIETWEDDYVLPAPVAFQTGGASTIVPTGLSPPKRTLTARTTVRVTTLDGCEQETYTKVEGFFNPASARYIAAGSVDGEPRAYPSHNVYFFDEVPAADDGAEGVAWRLPRFVVISESWEAPVWRADGRRLGTVTRTSGWRNPEASIKDRGGPGDPWETENYTAGRFLTGGFSGVLFDRERYFGGPSPPDQLFPSGLRAEYPGLGLVVSRHLTYAAEERTVTEDDYEPAVSTDLTAYGIRDGITQLYTSGSGRDDTEIGLTSTTRTEHATIAGRPTQIDSGRDQQGRPLPTVVTKGAGGGIPAAEICNQELEDEERQENFSVTVCLTVSDGAGGEVQLSHRTERLSSDFVETETEAEAWGLRELDILRSFPVALSLASPCPVLDIGDAVELGDVGYGLTGRCKVWGREVKIGAAPDGRVEDVVVVRMANLS